MREGGARRLAGGMGLAGVGLLVALLVPPPQEPPESTRRVRGASAGPARALPAGAPLASARRAGAGPSLRRVGPDAVPGAWLLQRVHEHLGKPDALPPTLRTNLDWLGGEAFLDEHALGVLEDLIRANGLREDSSALDHDDGDGRLEPLELGLQVWADERLLALALGPDPYARYGYRVETLPPSLGSLVTLRHLDLHSTGLEELPDEIGQLRELRELRLHGNRLQALPESIAGLRELRVLTLGGNALRSLPAGLEDLHALERLHLAGNPLTVLADGVGELRSLRVLDVSRPQSGRAGGLVELPTSLADLRRLEVLHVSGNRLHCAEPPPRYLIDGTIPHVYGLSAQGCEARP